jgi:hypothetical protein
VKTILTVTVGPAAAERLEAAPGRPLWIARSSQPQQGDPLPGRSFVLEYTPQGCRLTNHSPAGTLVNGVSVDQTFLRDGDSIVAGDRMFDVQVEESGPLLRILQRQAQPLFAILDAARDRAIPRIIAESGAAHQSLLEGEKGQALAAVAPYLVGLPPDSPLLRTLADQHWGASTCVYLTSQLPLSELRRHFREFLLVELPQGDVCYFRFYDPRVLRVFLPTCRPEEAARFFGGVRAFFVESEDARTLVRFTWGAEGTIQTELRLTSEQPC